MQKLLAITWKEVYATFTDRSLIVIMIVAPLTISIIVGSVFGGIGAEDGPELQTIPVALVNLDQGAAVQGETLNFGADIATLLTASDEDDDASASVAAELPACPLNAAADDESDAGSGSSRELPLAATLYDDEASARAAVENGDVVAAILIPATYSARLAPQINALGGANDDEDDANANDDAAALLTVYANSGQSISASIVRGIVEGLNNSFLTGNLAIEATLNTLIEQSLVAAFISQFNQNAGDVFSCGFDDALALVSVEQQRPGSSDQALDESQFSLFSQLLISVGSAQAVLFALFAGQYGIISIVEERRAGTWQRLLVSPTPRLTLLSGKLLGTLVTVVFQVILLLLALMLVASLNAGEVEMLWGTNLLGLSAVILAVSLAVCGLGVLISGIARTPEQVGTIGTVVNILLGVAGGAFGTGAVEPFNNFSLIYWGVDGFTKLGTGQGDILLNIGVLLLMAALFFGLGWLIFTRRVEI